MVRKGAKCLATPVADLVLLAAYRLYGLVGGETFIEGLAMIFRYPDSTQERPTVPVLCVEVVEDGAEAVTVAVHGEVDIATVELLDAGIEHGLHKKPEHLSVYLSDVSFFGATGLHTLLAARQRALEQSAQLVLCAPSRPVLTALRLARLKELFDIEDEPSAETADAR